MNFDSAARILTIDDLALALHEASRVLGQKEFVVIGSSALIPTIQKASALTRSVDIDLFPAHDTIGFDKDSVIGKSLGEDSEFRKQHDFYVQRVGDWTVKRLPPGWQNRATKVEVDGGIKALCLSPLDIAYNKIQASRPKDIDYVEELLRQEVITGEDLRDMIQRGVRDGKLEENERNVENVMRRLERSRRLNGIANDLQSGSISLQEGVKKGAAAMEMGGDFQKKLECKLQAFLKDSSPSNLQELIKWGEGVENFAEIRSRFSCGKIDMKVAVEQSLRGLRVDAEMKNKAEPILRQCLQDASIPATTSVARMDCLKKGLGQGQHLCL